MTKEEAKFAAIDKIMEAQQAVIFLKSIDPLPRYESAISTLIDAQMWVSHGIITGVNLRH